MYDKIHYKKKNIKKNIAYLRFIKILFTKMSTVVELALPCSSPI